MSAEYPKIPYGRADFRGIRLDGSLYVDKTAFIRPLEDHNYVLFIRPRRFGKTCWLSALECYYDRSKIHDFKVLFDDTDIGRSPTANRGRYVVLRFDFSAFGTRIDALEEDFGLYCFRHLRAALERHPDLFPEDAKRRILAPPTISGRLDALFVHAGEHAIPLYVLIDEYDNFSNNVLARHGERAYHTVTRDEGFFRGFFATLKGGTASGALERLFVTGVSPVAMDDVTSGFNIGRNLSLDPDFNAMLGFTEDEVRKVLETYHAAGALAERPDDALATMREWYNGYRFAERAERDVYNTDMVLYYLAECVPNREPPVELIDQNVRVDYSKLRHLLTEGGTLERQLRPVAFGDDRWSGGMPGASRLSDAGRARPRQFPLPATLFRSAEYPGGRIRREVGAQGAEPDRAPSAARLPARRLPGYGRVCGRPSSAPRADARHGTPWRVVSGGGVPSRGDPCTDECARLPGRGEDGTGLPWRRIWGRRITFCSTPSGS